MISDEAAEAAAKVIALSTGHIMESDWDWEHLPKEHYYKTSRAALESAAPHIRAEVLEAVAAELDGADRVTRERDGYTASISLPNAATYLRRRAVAERQAK